MSILISHLINILTEQEFHNLNYRVMQLAFQVHNELGRFYDEKIYQNKLTELCRERGVEVASEVKIE